MSETQKKKCLVLGGTGYIGEEVCRTLLQQGHQVALTYHQNEAKAQELSQNSHCKAISLNLLKMESIAQIIQELDEEWGGIDSLVQCAGIAGNSDLYFNKELDKFLDLQEEDWNEMMDITVKSTFFASQAFAKILRNRNQPGNLVFIGSMDGIKSVPAPIHYSASKGALVAMTTALAKDLGKDQILVNLVAPGILEGGIAKHLTEELLEQYKQHCALERPGKASEIANFAVWLATQNTYITGQSILLDGGL